MKFDCPTCKTVRHVDESLRDPRLDHCWHCGTLIPYSDEDLERFGQEIDPDYGKPLTDEERATGERAAFAASELGYTEHNQ